MASVFLALWATISGCRADSAIAPSSRTEQPSASESAEAARSGSDRSPLGLSVDTGWSHDKNSGDGYAYFRSSVFVDCAHTRVGNRQSADILTGAYAHRSDGSVSSYADMGVILENDALGPGQLGIPDKVQLYGQASTTAGDSLIRYDGPANADARALHVACDTQLTLTFWVANASELDLRYHGTFIEKRSGRRFVGSALARLSGFVPDDGWSATCARCAVRRAVTLAVGNGTPTRPGSYVGIRDRAAGRSGVRSSREPALHWTASIEGRFKVSLPLAVPGTPASYICRPFAAVERDIVNSPDAGEIAPAGHPAFLIEHEGKADELVGLDERV